jgi:endogenous inhibitor of DNA gyrase (YacG/DUF329 family)
MVRRTEQTGTRQEPNADSEDSPTVKLVTCPQCKGDSVYAPSNPYRPFCSQRCKDIDFGAWADESFRMPDETDPDALSPGENDRLQ